MRKYDTILFDLDGTLLDTLEDLTDSVNDALAFYGLPARRMGEVRRFVGNGVARLMELSVPGGRAHPQFEACLAEFRCRYAKNMRNKTRPYPGIEELLRRLSGEGCALAVVSNKFDRAVKELCRLYFGEYIKTAIGESEGVAKKPAPDTVFRALAELGSCPERTIYIGDSEVDVQTAKNAGVTCIGVTWGFRDRAVLEQEGANEIIDRPEELWSILSCRAEK